VTYLPRRCPRGSPQSGPVPGRSEPVFSAHLRAITRALATAAFALALLPGGPAHADSLDHIATTDWPSPSFVGLSGLELSDDGHRFYAISDRGWLLKGHFAREDGRIVDVTLDALHPILGQDGLPVAARRIGDWSDAEGLAMAPDGRYWISFERWARVAGYQAPDRPADWIRDHPDFANYPDNRQLEALALHPDGTLYTLPERPRDGLFPIYRLVRNTWEIADHIHPQDGFAIVGADFDSLGQLYLLERKLLFGLWWQNRVRRLDVATPESIETLWTSSAGVFDNLEGIALWQDPTGLRLTLISDNNGASSEPTQFVEFRLTE
jgi:hypothetical protein